MSLLAATSAVSFQVFAYQGMRAIAIDGVPIATVVPVAIPIIAFVLDESLKKQPGSG